MKRRNTRPYIFIFTLLAGLLAACGSSGGFSAESRAPMDAAAPAAMEEAMEEPALGAYAAADGSAPALASNPIDTRKIIANADVSLVVEQTEEAVARIEALVADVGGYVADANLSKSFYGETEALRGSLVLRIPAESLPPVLDQLQALATDVRSLNVSRQDVTEQYSDIEAQLRNLRATEEELLALLTEVRQKPNASPEDILTVHRSLMDIRGQIETLQGRKNLLDDQIGFSTVRVDLIPNAANRPIVEESWNASEPVRNALRALVNTLENLATALIWVLLYLTPLLLLVLVPLGVFAWLIRLWLRRRRRAKIVPVDE